MNDIELNEAVAYAAGWMYYDGWQAPNGDNPDQLPDFANYYDEIMPLVKALKKGREGRFMEFLFKLVYPHEYQGEYVYIHCIHEMLTATPRQLCEVYLAVGGDYA